MAKSSNNEISNGVKKIKNDPGKARKIIVHRAPRAKRLLDERAAPQAPDRLGRTALAILGFGLLLGGAATVYFMYFYNPVMKERPATQIIPPGPPPTPAPTATPAVVAVQQVEILDTPTGYLNVRKGAGTNFEKIAQVKPGEQYELVSEAPANGGWLQIRLDPGATGWVSKQYARVK